jgi:hypothetical protein
VPKKKKPSSPPKRSLNQLLEESKRLRAVASSIQEKMNRLADELERNRRECAKRAEN